MFTSQTGNNIIRSITAAFIFAALAIFADAQSTVFNTPSTDILPEGKIGLRVTAKFKFNDEDAKKKFSSFIPRIIYGLTRDVEIGANFLGNLQPGADATTFAPAVKWRFYQNEKHKVTFVAGDTVISRYATRIIMRGIISTSLEARDSARV